MDCELCGRPNAEYVGIVEKVKMNLCQRCAKHAQIIGKLTEEKDEVIKQKPGKEEIELEVVEDYAEIIKKEREKKGMTIKQLANELAEKESYIDKIEKGDVVPSEKVARKLEKYFNIKLLEEVVVTGKKETDTHDEPITLGDIIEIKKKKR